MNASNFIKNGNRARLFSTYKSSQLEQRLTSTTLSALVTIQPLAEKIFSKIGLRIGTRTEIFTYTEVYQQNDFFEQFVKINSLRELKVIAEVCMRLYYDRENDRHIPGTSKGTKGGFPRLRDKIAHYNKIKFLWKMNTDEIIEMLPSEFDKYKI